MRNSEMNEKEFKFSVGLKRAMNDLLIFEDEILRLKGVAPQGLSRGAMTNVEGRVYDLKAALINALKTVGN
jgi:hypothetical protein